MRTVSNLETLNCIAAMIPSEIFSLSLQNLVVWIYSNLKNGVPLNMLIHTK